MTSFVYAGKPETIDALEESIRRHIADIWLQLLQKVIEKWTSWLESAAAVTCSKLFLKHLNINILKIEHLLCYVQKKTPAMRQSRRMY